MFHTKADKHTAIRKWKATKIDNEIFKMEIDETEKKSNSIKLQGIPLEYPDFAVEEYLKKYFENPIVTNDNYPHTNYKNGIRTVEYSYLKRQINRVLYVGKNMPAYQIGPLELPMSDIRLYCENCLEEGHLQYGCENAVVCRRCDEKGHTSEKCEFIHQQRKDAWPISRKDANTAQQNTTSSEGVTPMLRK